MNPLNNKTLWSAIGSMYVTVGFAVLAKRYGEVAYWTYKEAVQEIRESEVGPHGKIFSKTNS